VNYLGNCRAVSGQRPRNFRAASSVVSDATSGESSGQLPGNFRAVSEQLAGNVSRNAGECPHHGWRNSSQVTWQFPLKSTSQITQQTGWQT
jgi:hypothetical protein